jgi:hypothetical protein
MFVPNNSKYVKFRTDKSIAKNKDGFVSFISITAIALISDVGWFIGLFLFISCAVQPASATSIEMPKIKIHQPNNSIVLCALYPPENRSSKNSATFSIPNPKMTIKPPTIAIATAIESLENNERNEFICFVMIF